MPVHVRLSELDLSAIRMSDFNNPDGRIKQGGAEYPYIWVKFDEKHYTNIDQALVFGTVRLVMVSKNAVISFGDTYNFDPKGGWSNLKRDIATMAGLAVNGFGRPYKIYLTGIAYLDD